jgi:hypothetical protein
MSSDHISANTDPGYWTPITLEANTFDLAFLVFAASHKAKL